MSRRAATVVIVLILAALGGVAALAIPGSPIRDEVTLGLDLQGGLEVTLQAVPPKDRDLTGEDLDRSVSIMRDRVDRLGVAEPEIRKQGDDQIVIQLPGVSDPEAAAQIIGKTAQLELFDLQANLVPPSIDAQRFPVATSSLHGLLAGQQSLVEEDQAESWYLFDKRKQVVVGPVASKQEALRGRGGKVPDGWSLFATPPMTVVLVCGVDEVVCPGVQTVNPDTDSYYLIRYDPPEIPEMTGADLELSGTRSDFNPQTGEPIVTLAFTDAGADKFQEITREIAQRGKLLSNTVGQGQKIEQNFAIVLDREIKSWPSIDWELYPGGISGNNGAQITGLGDVGEANDLALVLQTGALPVRFETLDQTAISATLGKDSLDEAKNALIVGLLLVAVFLLVFYRFLGLVAVLGLGIYAAFLYAAILLFNVTLTLPGIAGLVLTLGVAADANVVIFERVKEEARAGRSVRAAISAGYTKGFATIVDANVVTMITALVLFAVATASVRGFALMLLIGTAISMLTAVLATRALLSMLGSFSWIESPRLMGASGRGVPAWLKIDFIGLRRVWLGLSALIVIVSILSLGVLQLNLGIDFEGGTQINFRTTQPVALEEVRSQAAEIGQAGAVIQGRGEPVDGRYSNFQIRTESLDREEVETLNQGLTEAIGATSFGVKNVSESFGRQIANSALVAIFVSLLLICGYIALRFQWKFALPVIVAMFHDIVITLGIYALVGREVTTATVAAILTVLGYSIYDTIIIFDRVRENTPLMKRASFRAISNVSLWEVIPRSLATTFITLLPIASLYLLGGDTLKDFAFALLVGIGAGAYSSIFVAAPLLAWIKEREPEFARRKAEDDGSLEGIQTVGGALAGSDAAEEKAAAAALATQVEEGAPAPAAPVPVAEPAAAGAAVPAGSKRERRRQRRSSRPHGRAR